MTDEELFSGRARAEASAEAIQEAEERAGRAEEALRDSLENFARAEQIASMGYWSLDLRTGKVSWSDGHFRIFGYPVGAGQDFYRMFRDRVHPDDLPGVEAHVRKAIEAGTPYRIDYRIVLPDGALRYIHEEAEQPSTDEAGRKVKIFGIINDLTGLRLAEQSILKTQENLLKAEKIAKIGYYEWILQTGEVICSAGYRQIFHLPEAERLTHEKFLKLVHPADLPALEASIRYSLEHDVGNRVEFRSVLPDGSIRHIHTEPGKPQKDAAGRPVKFFGVIHDITERRLAQEALRQSEEKYRTIVETANEGICIIKDGKTLVFVNKKFAEMLGYTQEELTGKTLYDVTDRDNHDILRKNMSSRMAGATDQFDYKLRHKDGRIVWIIAAGSPLYDETGHFRGSLAMITDITDRQLADEQLKASLREKEALLKEIHHRVKNNLQIISSLLNLQSNVVADETFKDLLLDSQNRIKSMALIHELLYKSKDLSSINISEYLHGLTLQISRSYQQYSAHVSLAVAVQDLDLDVETAINVGIIVTELVSNAIKYAFPGGRSGEIRVELRRAASDFLLTVSDDGVGLPKGLDVHSTPTLGLQLVEILTGQLNGTLEVEREGITAFKIRFPATGAPK